LVLVLEMGDWVSKEEGQEDLHIALINGTFVLVVLYLFVFGSTTGPCLRCLGLPLGDQVPDGQELYDPKDTQGLGWRAVKYMRKKVILPIVSGPQPKKKLQRALSRDKIDESVLADVIRQAEDAEAQPEFGHKPHRHNAASGMRERALERRNSMISLFGSLDPVHVDAIEDCVEDFDETAERQADSDDSDASSDEEEGSS